MLDVTIADHYSGGVIESFACRQTQRLFEGKPFKRLPNDLHRVALRKLTMLNAATKLAELRVPPSNRLEKLRGDRAGQYSIRINDQWRVCFRWHRGSAYDVAIVDYHG